MYIFFLAGTVELLIRQFYRDHHKDSIKGTFWLIAKDIYRPLSFFVMLIALPIYRFFVRHFELLKKIMPWVLSIVLVVIIASNLTFQTKFYDTYYKFESNQRFFSLTGIYQLIVIFAALIVSFLLRKKLSFGLRCLFVFLSVAIIQVVVFNITSYEVRTQAVITGLSKDKGAMWSEVTIYGNNFGNAPYNGAAVFIEGVPQRVLVWKNDTIIFVVDPYDTRTGELWVQNVNQRKSNTMKFEYIPL